MQTAALIAALFFGTVGFASLLGISMYAGSRIHRDLRKTLSSESRQLLNWLYVVAGVVFVGGIGLGAGSGKAGISVLAVLIGVVAAAFLLVDLGRATLRVISQSRSRRH
jgi:hypothetical protein